MRKPASMKALEKLGRVRLSEHFFMREMLHSEIANFHGIPNIPDDPDLAVAAGTRLCEELLEPPARDLRPCLHPLRLPLGRGQHLRPRALEQGLQLRRDNLELCETRVGSPRCRGPHGGDRLYRDSLVHPALRSGHALAGPRLVDTRQSAVLGHGVLPPPTPPSIFAGASSPTGASRALRRPRAASPSPAWRTTPATTPRNTPASPR